MWWRAAVGPEHLYDTRAAIQFCLLVELGLREHHSLLDIGCGSLRAGRLFIPYLLPGRYYGIEPNRELVEAGIEYELGRDAVELKSPTFLYRDDFCVTEFGHDFDFVLAQSIFSHAHPGQIETCFNQVAQTMHDDSIFLANYKIGKENHIGTEWVYPRNVRYTQAFFDDLASGHGLTCRPLEPYGKDGMWVVIRKVTA